ncbi:DUF3592 domain-containing protein [Streptomyces sp. NPDC052114]|uniref:DUF3592 domain-containing protein n=1 Tax=unclassified Streptomyces TaxID=2593676 RepID=UPI003420531A
MEFMFYAVATLIAVMLIVGAVRLVKRSGELDRAWRSGLTAQARCLRAYTTTRGGGGNSHVTTTLHHVYEFTTLDGRYVRFEEEHGPATTVEGDLVTVHYEAARPEAATAQAPRPYALTAGTFGLLCFLGVMLVLCIYFMVSVNDMFADDVYSDLP